MGIAKRVSIRILALSALAILLCGCAYCADSSITDGNAIGDRPYETIISKLGSRFMLNLQPQRKVCMDSVLGKFYDKPRDLIMGLEVDGKLYALPFSKSGEAFGSISQIIRPTSIEYQASLPDKEISISFKITAPFYPEDVKTSTAPFFYVDVSVSNSSTAPKDCSIKLLMADLKGEKLRTIDGKPEVGVIRSCNGSSESQCILASPSIDVSSNVGTSVVSKSKPFSGLQWQCQLAKGATISRSAVISGYATGDVLFVKSEGYHFLYTEHFKDALEVAEWAISDRRSIMKKNAIFESTVMDSGVSADAKKLICFGFQSWLSNTWWVKRTKPSQELPDEWFSIWEGNCRFNSTVDVVYNDGLILTQYWPSLMRMQFSQWNAFSRPGWIPHDIGVGNTINGQKYPHDMEVEEACNYVLLLHHYWKQTGRTDVIDSNYAVIQNLADALAKSDTDGNGLPDKGTSNTVDQGSRAVQHAANQTYLGIKALAAYLAAEDIATNRHDDVSAKKYKGYANQINNTVEAELWKTDHYAVYIGPGVDPAQDAYSIYTSNGFLYLMRSGMAPSLSIDRLRQDIQSAATKTGGQFGCTHTSLDTNMWISQNIWRDMAGGYLGVDFSDEASKYWKYESELNRTQGGCFADSYNYPCKFEEKWRWNTLNYYPRGATAIGLIYSSGGIGIDACKKTIRISPLRLPVTIPLATLADWPKEMVPVIKLDVSGKMTVLNDSLIKDWKISLSLPK